MTARPDINVDLLATLEPGDHIRYDQKHHGIITNVNTAEKEYGVILFSIDGITGNETLDTVEWDPVVIKFRCGEFVKILHDYELKNQDEELDCLDGPTGVTKSEDEFTKYKNDMYIDVIHTTIKRQLSSKPIKRPTERKISDIRELQPGDHVIYKQPGLSHHAIVVKVDGATYEIVHFKSPQQGRNLQNVLAGNLSIRRDLKTLSRRESVFVIDYEESDRFPPMKTVEIALALAEKKDLPLENSQDDEVDGKRFNSYNILENNCEHLATFCATGRSESTQADTLEKLIDAFHSRRYFKVLKIIFKLIIQSH